MPRYLRNSNRDKEARIDRKMRHFRLNIILLLVGVVVTTGVAALLFVKGMWAQGILMMLLTVAALFGIWHLQTRLIRTMSGFVSSLEVNDTTMRIDTGGDRELIRMTNAMNRISELYRRNLQELETRKLYYDRILRIMTHEMRNGITPLAAMTADMMEHPESYPRDTIKEIAQLMNGQVEGVRRFLDSYYTLTHLPEPELITVKAGDYFRNLRLMAEAELQSRGLAINTVQYVVPEDMMLSIDPALMNQVILNLLRNALDAVASTPNPRVEVVISVSDTHPYLTVSDNGEGIPEKVMDNLFQPFYTTKPGGSGVGLSICRQIVRRHGGELTIRSRVGKGTDAVITL